MSVLPGASGHVGGGRSKPNKWKIATLSLVGIFLILFFVPFGKADLSLGNQFIQLILQSGQTQDPFTISNATGSTLAKIDVNGNAFAKSLNATNITAKNIGGVIYADQYASLQDAINATSAYGVLNLPANGIISPTSTIQITKPITIKGQGRRDTIIQPTSAVMNEAINISLSGIYAGSFVDLSGFTLDLSQNPTIDGIEVGSVTNQVYFSDLRFTYGMKQLKLTATASSYFKNLVMYDANYSAIYINGDNGAENSFSDILISSNSAGTTMNSGLNLVRTTTTDTGGIYLDNIRIVRNLGGGPIKNGINMTSSASTRTDIFAFINNLVVDGTLTGDSCLFNNVGNVRMINSWCNNGGNYSALHLMSSGSGSTARFMLSTNWLASPVASIMINGTADTIFGDNLQMYGSNPAILTDTLGTKTNIFFTPNNYFDYVGNYSNDPINLSLWGGQRSFSSGIQINTNYYAGTQQALSIYDPSINKYKYLRLDGSGTLQILNNTFSPIFTLTDSGILALNGVTNFGKLSSSPTANGAGDTYFNTAKNLPCYYNGTNWNYYNNNSAGC